MFFNRLIQNVLGLISKGTPHTHLRTQVNIPRWIGKYSVRCNDPSTTGFHWPHLILLSTIFLTPFLLPLTAHSSPSHLTTTVLVPTTASNQAKLSKSHWQASLQILFPTNSIQPKLDTFSELLKSIPEEFPEFKLNTVGRGLHSSIMYLPELTLNEIREITQFFHSLDAATLRQYHLDQPVKVFDPNHIRISIIGRAQSTQFLAIDPHHEFVQWQLNLWKLLSEKLPHLAAKHINYIHGAEVNESSVHISLLQWGPKTGLFFSETEIAAARSKLTQILTKIANKSGPIHFNWRDTSIETVTAPRSIHSLATPIVSFRLAYNGGHVIHSTVGRLPLDQGLKQEGQELPDDQELLDDIAFATPGNVEFSVEDLLAGRSEIVRLAPQPTQWIETRQNFPHLDMDVFLGKLPNSLRHVVQREISRNHISPTQYPALVAHDGKDLYVTTFAHPRINPSKAKRSLEMLAELGIRSTETASVGTALYASSVRREVENPGDADTLINTLVHVPDTIQTLEEAKRYAVRTFINDVLNQFIQLVKQGNITITELRSGSPATMGHVIRDLIDSYEDNPYLSQRDVLNHSFVDSQGKKWSLEDLLMCQDFTKGKISYYRTAGNEVEREDISLQFLVGFSWKGSVIPLQSKGLKGIPPLLRTAVYQDAESFAIAAALSRAFAYSSVQRGNAIPYAIRDLQSNLQKDSQNSYSTESDLLWNPKFLKKIYNFLIFVNASGLGLDEFFFTQTKDLLIKEGKLSADGNYDIKTLTDKIISVFNRTPLRVLNELKRNINECREYNERGWLMQPQMWQEHVKETDEFLLHLHNMLDGSQLNLVPSKSFKDALNRFETLFRKASKLSNSRGRRLMRLPRYYNVLKNFETELKKLESEFDSAPLVTGALSQLDMDFIQTFTSYLPLFWINYMNTRSLESNQRLRWNLDVMKQDPQLLGQWKTFSTQFYRMTRSQVASVQRILRATHLHGAQICDQLLSGQLPSEQTVLWEAAQ